MAAADRHARRNLAEVPRVDTRLAWHGARSGQYFFRAPYATWFEEGRSGLHNPTVDHGFVGARLDPVQRAAPPRAAFNPWSGRKRRDFSPERCRQENTNMASCEVTTSSSAEMKKKESFRSMSL